ncbi:MAG TPA: hypothetical protein VKG38_18430 [Solirubrobacteraceae bacterium]|nr:hypothetical protein [Solirubrobacteraceae bacterium]
MASEATISIIRVDAETGERDGAGSGRGSDQDDRPDHVPAERYVLEQQAAPKQERLRDIGTFYAAQRSGAARGSAGGVLADRASLAAGSCAELCEQENRAESDEC